MTPASLRPALGLARIFVLLLCLSLVPVASAGSLTSHQFTFDTTKLPAKPQSVSLAGSFNGWSAVATPMSDDDGDGVYEATLKLADGVHFYKFVVDGNQWLNDPKSDKELEQPDGHGGVNSAVLIGPDVRKLPAPKPNDVNLGGVVFDPENPMDLNVFDEGWVRIRVRAMAGDVESVQVVPMIGADGPNPGASTPPIVLRRLCGDRGFDVFGGVARIGPPPNIVENGRFSFMIELRDGTGAAAIVRNARIKSEAEARAVKPQYFSVSATPQFHTPDWAKHAVWYQIFPERFRNGDPSNDPGDKEYENLIRWQADWWKTHVDAGEAPGEENFYKGEGNVWKRRYGGDIKGVKEALPYLRRLGVNAIYFNPVFEADSMHKYDASDFRHIDDNFGVKGDIPIEEETDDPSTWKWSESDKLFLDFIEEAHRQGFKVIIDGVFNHVGQSHPFFQDVIKNGKNSKYADWFEITDWGTGGTPGEPGGIQWRAWDKPNGHLPVFRKDEKLGLAQGPREHIFAITKRWLAPDGDPSKGIDGWRLDVPGDIPHPFWIEWRKVVKQANPDAYITGELWDWAQAWLQGDQFDAVMNYRFAVACQDFFVNQRNAIPPSEFNARLNQMIYAYPLQVALVQQNLFDSHDTDRLASMFVNPDLPYDGGNRLQDNGPSYKRDKPNDVHWQRKRQAVTFQMMFLGAPMIYYGDEAGMWSPDDPSNRMPMWWKDHEPFDDPSYKFDEQHFAHYQRAIAIRNRFQPLRTGFFRPLVIDDERGVYAFVRELGDERLYVVLNRSNRQTKVELPASETLVDWMDESSAKVSQPNSNKPDARPTIELDDGAQRLKPTDGKVTIELKPYGTAVLARN